jgi:hypothetical protein
MSGTSRQEASKLPDGSRLALLCDNQWQEKYEQIMRKFILVFVIAVAVFLPGCRTSGPGASKKPPTIASPATGTPTPTENVRDLSSETITPNLTPAAVTATPTYGIVSGCGLAPIAIPSMAPYPGANALDRSTGLHVTGRAVPIDLTSYRLLVTGLVDSPLSLSYEDLRCMPRITAKPTLVCIGVFEDITTWSGVPLNYILNLAGVLSGAKTITMVAADRYESQIVLQAALEDGNFLAYEWNGQPLPVLHGFPLRAVLPALPGSKWVKWLLEIKVE